MKPIKDYAEVQIGDIAYENPDAGGYWDNVEGPVLWKGTLPELRQSKYVSVIGDWEDISEQEMNEYDLVVIETEIFQGVKGPILFNYNNDPCGVVVFK